MKYIFSTLLLLAWGLWLGGLVTIFLILLTLFHADHDLAAKAGPIIFPVFERYQLVVGATALLAVTALYILTRSRFWMVVFAFMALGTMVAAVSMFWLTPKIVALAGQGLTKSDEFRSLHGKSMMHYSAETIILLVVGLLLVWGIRAAGAPTGPIRDANAAPTDRQ